MGDVEIYNKILKQVSDRIAETLVHFQGELEIQRLERDRAISRAEVNQRKADLWRTDYETLKEAYDHQTERVSREAADAWSWRKKAVASESNYQERVAKVKALEGLLERLRRGEDDAPQLHPHYTSTYCIHGLHDECRRTCKTCDQPCLCEAEDCPCSQIRPGVQAVPLADQRLNEVGQAYIDAHPEVDWTSTAMTLKLNGEHGGYEVTGHRVLEPTLREALQETLGQVPIPPEAEPR